MEPLTVILPTFNGARYLPAQIESILSQRRADFRLVTVDDGSSDDTTAIIDRYIRQDRRVSRLPSAENLGQRVRLRQLVAAVSTPFVAFADQDDLWHPDRNALLLDAIGDRALAFGRSQLVSGDGVDLGRSILSEHGIDPHRAGPLGGLFRALLSAHATIARRDWIDLAVFSGPRQFDWVMGLEAMLSRGLVYVDDAIVMHRIHGGNQMNAGAVRSRPKLASRQQLRNSTSFVSSNRLYFFLLIDQLSRSLALPPDTRRAFELATHACRYAWYQPLDFRFGKARRLEADLHRLLGRFASGTDDLAVFSTHIASIVRSQVAPTNLLRAMAHYRGRLD